MRDMTAKKEADGKIGPLQRRHLQNRLKRKKEKYKIK